MSYEEEIAWGVQQMLDADLQFPQEVHYSKKPVRTNADHIRSMTDEELAEFLCGVYDDENCGVYQDECGKFICGVTIIDYDQYKIADWLKQPYGGDT